MFYLINLFGVYYVLGVVVCVLWKLVCLILKIILKGVEKGVKIYEGGDFLFVLVVFWRINIFFCFLG